MTDLNLGLEEMGDTIDWAKMAPSLEPIPPHFSPHTPYFKQKIFLLIPALEVLYGGRAGGGKLLKDSIRLPTPDGFKTVRDIHPGDIIFDELGKPTTVLAESDTVHEPAWRFTFDDNSEVTAHKDHLWLTYDDKELRALTTRNEEWRKNRRENRPSGTTGNKSKAFTDTITKRNQTQPTKTKPAPTGTVRSTQEIVDTLLTSRGRKNHAIPVCEPLELPSKDLLIDPYLFGAWLGDGSTSNPEITTMDPEMIQAFEKEGYVVSSVQNKENSKASTYYFAGRFRQELKRLGVFGGKFIPEDYLWGSEEQRTALLQGLLDTDGNVNKASVEFTNMNENLTQGVAQLARSLGMKVAVRTKEAKIGNRSYGTCYTVKFAANRKVFRLPRKADAQSIASRRTNKFRYIKSAEPVEPVDLKCLRVAADSGLFLCSENFIPTHNSDALLMAALQYVDVPGYAAIIFRNSYSDLILPGALMDRAREWFEPQMPEVRWSAKTNSWIFPSGATVTFGYLDKPDDHLRYKGAEFQYIGFDEVTEIRKEHYTYLFSRLRKPSEGPLAKVPLRCRAASNPAPNWVRERFIEDPIDKHTGRPRIYIPAGLEDNPYIEQDSYREALSRLNPTERARLEGGDWYAEEEGAKFQREWFKVIHKDDVPQEGYSEMVRYWDTAATIPTETNPDPDYTAGALVSIHDGVMFIHDIKRDRRDSGGVEDLIYQTAHEDGPSVKVRMEQEPGASGKMTIDHYARHILLGFDFDGHPAVRKKEERADNWAGNAKRGHVLLVRPQGYNWVSAFLDEVTSFGAIQKVHDDQIDAVSGAYEILTDLGGGGPRRLQIIV